MISKEARIYGATGQTGELKDSRYESKDPSALQERLESIASAARDTIATIDAQIQKQHQAKNQTQEK